MNISYRFTSKSVLFSILLIGLLLFPTLAYAANAPVITAVYPSSGPRSGGTMIQINGFGFQPGAKVVIGGNQAPTAQVVSSTLIYAITPSSTVSGSAVVRVRNPDGQVAIFASGFIYY